MGYFNNSDVIQTDLSLAGSNTWSTEFKVLDVSAEAPAGTAGWFVYHPTCGVSSYKVYLGFYAPSTDNNIGVEIYNGNEALQFSVNHITSSPYTDVDNISAGNITNAAWNTGASRPYIGSVSTSPTSVGSLTSMTVVPNLSGAFQADTGLPEFANYPYEGVVIEVSDPDKFFIAVDGAQSFDFDAITTFTAPPPPPPPPPPVVDAWEFRATEYETGTRRHLRLRHLGFNA